MNRKIKMNFRLNLYNDLIKFAEQKFRLEHYEDFSFKLNKEIWFTKSC